MLTSTKTRTVARLAVAQALSMTSMNVNIINTALVGVLLAPMAWLATLPLSLQFLTSMMVTLPASLLMSRYGRRPILIAGVLISSRVDAVPRRLPCVRGDFLLFCAAAWAWCGDGNCRILPLCGGGWRCRRSCGRRQYPRFWLEGWRPRSLGLKLRVGQSIFCRTFCMPAVSSPSPSCRWHRSSCFGA